MEEQRGISSGVVSEPASNSVISGEKRNGNGLDEKDELGSKRVKVPDLASDAKTSSLQSHGNSNSVQQPNLSSEKLSKVSKVLVAPDAEGIRRVVRENDVLSKDIKPSSTVETRTYLPKAKSISTDDNRRVVNSGKQALLENHTVKTDDSKCRVVKNISLLKPRETTESVVSQRGAAEPSVSVPVGDKVSPFQMCSSADGSLGESDSMRRWREMKRNGFLSGPLGGVAAPTSTVVTTPVEVPAPKQQKNKRRGGESLKKKNDVPKKEQQLVDRFANVTAPSGLLTELNPGIINHVRTKKQVCSIIEALIRSSNDDATTRERHGDFNVRGIYLSFLITSLRCQVSQFRPETRTFTINVFAHSVYLGISDAIREDRALAFKLPSTGVSDNAISITNPEQATSLAVEGQCLLSCFRLPLVNCFLDLLSMCLK
jgi:hypothetical protein